MRILAVFAGSLLVVGLIFLSRPETQAELREIQPRVVAAVAVEHRNIQHITKIAGKLQPSHTASLRFEVAGRVKRRLVEPGQRVAAGQALLEVDNGDYLDAVTENRALLHQEISAIERDRALLALEEKETALLERELERLAKLGREALTSKSHYDEAEQRLIRQQAEVARLRHSVATATVRRLQREATLKRAERNLDRAKLVSPFDAIVNRVLLEEGDYTASGQHAIDLIQVRELDVYLEIPGDLAETLALNQVVDLSADGQEFPGRIVALAFDPDPLTNTHALRIRVDGATLYPGKIVLVELPGRFHAQAKVIPVTAALDEYGESHVFVIRQDRLVKQAIQVIAQHDNLRIVEGLDVGTMIVARDVAAYSDGQEVVVKKP